MNTDGAWGNTGTGGIGNETGVFIAALVMRKSMLASPLLMEAYAVLEGLLFCRDTGIFGIEVDMDNQYLLMLNQNWGTGDVQQQQSDDIGIYWQLEEKILVMAKEKALKKAVE
ncbi:hypothetical protein F0562_019813 [Nyssa sinensis]|uniref:RNase H type-1 domain-containing protein n=1 Tax=Nyssa sinensis TaxID=561372 RepID=A0A5J5BSD0_9ASTE|nr:hypothetical protein F0562_019813 [Nyssa sinensis]